MLVKERCAFCYQALLDPHNDPAKSMLYNQATQYLHTTRKPLFFSKAVVRELMDTLCLAILRVYSGLTDVCMLLGHRHHHTAYDRLETI